MTQSCCWLDPQDVKQGCETLASFEVWTLNERGQCVLESDTYACPAHLVALMPAGADYQVLRLETPGVPLPRPEEPSQPEEQPAAPAESLPPPPPSLEMKDLTEELMAAILAKVDAGVPPLHAVQSEGVHGSAHVGWMLAGGVHVAARQDTLQARYSREMKERAKQMQAKRFAAGKPMVPTPDSSGADGG